MPRGGWRGKPGSILALQLRGNRGWSHCPQCSRPGCTLPAVYGVARCMMHGGAASVRKVTPLRKQIRAARAAVRSAVADGLVPEELRTHPTYVTCHHKLFVHYRPLLIAAWHSPDPGAWGRELAKAEAALALHTFRPYVPKPRKTL